MADEYISKEMALRIIARESKDTLDAYWKISTAPSIVTCSKCVWFQRRKSLCDEDTGVCTLEGNNNINVTGDWFCKGGDNDG